MQIIITVYTSYIQTELLDDQREVENDKPLFLAGNKTGLCTSKWVINRTSLNLIRRRNIGNRKLDFISSGCLSQNLFHFVIRGSKAPFLGLRSSLFSTIPFGKNCPVKLNVHPLLSVSSSIKWSSTHCEDLTRYQKKKDCQVLTVYKNE